MGIGALAFAVESSEEAVLGRIEHLFAGFSPSLTGAEQLTVVVELRPTIAIGDPPLYDASVDGEPLLEGAPLPEVEIRITRLVNDRKLDTEPHLLHLHCAAVTRGDRAVLLAARSGSGKSSLAAALVRAGWDYATDEQVAIDPTGHHLIPYPRPITLREPVWMHFPELALSRDTPGSDTQNERIEVSPNDLGRVTPAAQLTAVAIVFPTYIHPDGDDEQQKPGLHAVPTAAEVVERLAACCYDLERLGHAGLATLAHLATRGAVWDLPFSDLGTAVGLVGTAWEQAAVASPIGVRRVVGTATRTMLPGELRCAPDAEAWVFADDSVVVFRPSALTLSRLDGAGFALWEALGEPLTSRALAERMGAEKPASLASLDQWLAVMVEARLVERG